MVVGIMIALATVLIIGLCLLFIKLYITLRTTWDRSPTCLVGKTVIVTGSNTGIGFYTAQDFAKRGARVILACRDPQRAEDARVRIAKATGNQNVIVRIVDLGSLASVRKFAKTINSTEEKLDILVNNAAAGGFDYTVTSDGLSLSMQINHFGPFLLTLLLLDLLKRSAPSRIVIVSSESANQAKLNVEDLNARAGSFVGLSGIRDYSNTKLCNVLFANELARKLEGTGVDCNSVHPGAVQTDFFRNFPPIQQKFGKIFIKLLFKTTEAGAQTPIYVSVSKEIDGISGEYFAECKIDKMPKHGRDLVLAKQVWEKSVEFVKLLPQECSI